MKLRTTFLVFFLLTACIQATPTPTPVTSPTNTPSVPGLPADEAATLNSLEKLDDYPLYTMRYSGSYTITDLPTQKGYMDGSAVPTALTGCQITWGCSLFAAMGDPGNRLYGRNFDWRFSPALLLFTDPPDGYASVSMVDIEYLGFEGDESKDILDLPLEERRALLDAPALPFDGMNEQGLAIGMAAVPASEMPYDPEKKTLDELEVIRQVLDHASIINEAIDILSSYNIDMGNVPIHYLIASASGSSALIEFYQGKMEVFWNEDAWQTATNFLVASTGGKTQGQCPRYDRITRRFQEIEGQLAVQDALNLLSSVSQSITQWSIVYNMSSGDISIVMGRGYTEEIHTLHLDLSDK